MLYELSKGFLAQGCSHSKVVHVDQEGIDLDNLVKGGTSLLEDSLEVGNALSSLLLNGALNQVALSVTGDLARAVDGGRGLDGLGLWQSSESIESLGTGPG
jgi:hypothetical protein